MAEKAVVEKVYGVDHEADPDRFILTVQVSVTNGIGPGHVTMQVEAESTVFNPVSPNWRTRIKDAIAAKALAEHDLVVDEVMFSDFGIL